MPDIILVVIATATGLSGIMIIMIAKSFNTAEEDMSIWGTLLVVSAVVWVWLVFGLYAPRIRKTETFPIITMTDNVQAASVHGELININKTLKQAAGPNQVLQVTTIENTFRGGVCFTTDKPEYKLVNKGE
jgi:hypothetical protein